MNPILDKALSDAIRTVDSPEFPEALSRFLSKVAPIDNLIVFAYHKDHNPEILYRECVAPNIYARIDEYIKAAYLLDPFYHAICSGIQTGMHHLFDLAPDKFKQSTYFKEYYRNTTSVDEVVIFARVNHDTTINVCFGRDIASNMAFSKKDLALFRDFGATLSALCEIHWKQYQPLEGKNVTLSPISDRLQKKLYQDTGIQLSQRQAEVALLILQGHSSLSIALHLGISKETVKVFRKQLYAKCNISSQAELFALLMTIMAQL